VSNQTDEIQAAASELSHAMARLVRAMDAVEDDQEASLHLSEGMSEALERLAARVSAAVGYGD
jgi:hypothetical protein